MKPWNVFSLVFFVVVATLGLAELRQDLSHEALGSKSHACFANHTCREGLRCLIADGIEQQSGVCVKP